MASRTLKVEIIGDASSLNRALGQSQSKASRFGRVAKTALIGGVATGLYAVGKAAKIGWDEYNKGAAVAAQTNAVIKSTGGVANVSAGRVEDLGKQLMLLSGIDDEVIKSGENVLLTFRGIRNEAGKGNKIFDRATKATLDLSVALGRDMSDSAIQVGKALQDPIRGLTALRRVGVQFTAAQEELITKLVETGRTEEAQKIILRELNKEFGGSAKAAGETFGGQLNILRERLNNFLGDLTEKAIPYLQRFIKWVGPKAHEALEIGKKAVAEARKAWARFGEVLQRHQSTIEKVQTLIHGLSRAIVPLIKWNILLYSTIFKVWMKVLDVVLTVTDKVIGAVQRIIDWIRKLAPAFNAMRGVAQGVFAAVRGYIMSLVGPIATVIGWVKDAIGWFRDLFNTASSVGSAVGSAAATAVASTAGRAHRAMGGPVSAGRQYIVGERGPELFIPSSNGRIAANGGRGVMQVNVMLDRRVLGSALVDMDKDYRKANGGRPLFA